MTAEVSSSLQPAADRLRTVVGRTKESTVPGIDSMTSISTTSGSCASSQYNVSPEHSSHTDASGMLTVEQWLQSHGVSLEDSAHEPVNATYGPVRKCQRSSERTLICTTPGGDVADDEDDSLSEASLQSATSSVELLPQTRWLDAQPQFNLKIRYSHYENAAVFVAMASKMILREHRPTTAQQPYAIFRAESDDPELKANLSSFAERLAFGMRCKYPCYVLALLYLEQVRAKQSEHLPITYETFQRLIIAAIVVAAKFYDDLYYSNEYYARELGLRLEVVNTLEICFLVVQDFNLRVSSVDFDRMMLRFDSSRHICCEQERQPVWSGLKSAAIHPSLVPVVAVANSLLNSQSKGDATGGIYVDLETKRAANAHLVSREWRGYRYETEEEYLYKSEVLNRCRSVKKLLDQYEEEVHKVEEARRQRWRAPGRDHHHLNKAHLGGSCSAV